MDTQIPLNELLDLHHLSRSQANYLGLLSKCPECKKELLYHPHYQYEVCLTKLAIKKDKKYDRNKFRDEVVKELQNER